MKKKIDNFCIWTLFLAVICLCWAGAEYYFEGGVNPSSVDTVVAMILAWYMTQDYNRRIRKEGDHGNQ